MASPAGYKIWSAGEVLQASELMSYLMDQSVLVFSGTAAEIGRASCRERV